MLVGMGRGLVLASGVRDPRLRETCAAAIQSGEIPRFPVGPLSTDAEPVNGRARLAP